MYKASWCLGVELPTVANSQGAGAGDADGGRENGGRMGNSECGGGIGDGGGSNNSTVAGDLVDVSVRGGDGSMGYSHGGMGHSQRWGSIGQWGRLVRHGAREDSSSEETSGLDGAHQQSKDSQLELKPPRFSI